jgi:hypothetical protein
LCRAIINNRVLLHPPQEYAQNLKESGVHGAVLVLEPTFNADAFAAALGIPTSKSYVRRHLATELEALVRPVR